MGKLINQILKQLISSSSLAYRNFSQTCRSTSTRTLYTKALHYFMNYLQLTHGQYDKLLEKDPKMIQMDICDFVMFLKQSNLSYAAISSYVAAIKKFYDMNDITTLNWRKVKHFMGEHEKIAEDRPYTHSEIHTLLEATTYRNRGIILLMCSAGLRLGAIPILRIRDLEPIDKYLIYKIDTYARSKKFRYTAFCTPECRHVIDNYINSRRRAGERIEDDSPLFRVEYNMQKVNNVIPISESAIRDFMYSLLLDTGIRKPPLEGKIKRTYIMMNHGHRKFFETNAFKAGMDHMYIRRLMGQKSGLEDAYLKLSEEELLEGDSKHVGYIGIIDHLTINEENRLKREVKALRIEKSKMEQVLERINMLENKILNRQ